MTDIQKFDIIEPANPVLTVAPIEEETEMLGATDKITALYCRLSVEDLKEGKNGEKADESNSIQTQKMILLQYAKQNHFPNPTFFVDDGYSGVDFDNRPGFQQMLAEVKTGRVGTIITKDLSRLGRNSALTSLYINIAFPKSGVRYIAINDHFDSINMNSTESDMAGIKNWFNEYYAKDTSHKIRAVQKAKGERGVPLTTNVPYGYIKDKENPQHIQLVMGYILRYRQHFIFVMEQQLQLESAEKLQTSRKQLEHNERRISELKRLFAKIYEDNVKGKLNDERLEMMSQNYEAEQRQLEAEVVALRQEIEVQERQNENIERFIRTADKYVDIEEIDPCMLRELIKAIYVEAPDKSSGKRRQKIHIEYGGIGFIPLEKLAKKETA